MPRTSVNNISAVGLIHPAGDASTLFIEVKDGGHPVKLVRWQLCPIGGNWIGEQAKADANPLDTYRREIGEELSFERPIRQGLELALLGLAEERRFEPTPAPMVTPTSKDQRDLALVKEAIVASAAHFGDFLNTVPKAALDAADPENKRDGFTTLCSYWVSALGYDAWVRLVSLQEKFKNLSNESITLTTSVEEIVRTGTKTAFAHDHVLRRFLQEHGVAGAEKIPLVPNLESVPAGHGFLASYDEYLARYDVAKKPM